MTTLSLKLPKRFADRIKAQALAESPNEACGLLAGRDGEASRMFEMTNAERSPVLYRMEPKEQLRVFNEIDEAGLDLVAIYHSHTRSPAYPSDTDVRLAYYPDTTYLICSLQDRDDPVLRGFRIVDGRVDEVELELTDG